MAATARTALVTGATSGLGFEATAQLAEAGYEQVIGSTHSCSTPASRPAALWTSDPTALTESSRHRSSATTYWRGRR